MPRGKTRRTKKSIPRYSRRQKGGYFFLPGSLVKLKPERADEIIGKIKAKSSTCTITPEDVFEVVGYERKKRDCFLTLLVETRLAKKEQSRHCIPIHAVDLVFENKRSDLSELADETPILGFFQLSTAQQQLVDPTKRYKIYSKFTDPFLYSVALHDAPRGTYGRMPPLIRILRNQIIVEGDSVDRVFTNANRNQVLNIRRKLFNIPKIEYPLQPPSPNTVNRPKFNFSPYEAILQSDDPEIVKFRVFQQHEGNCWSDALFTILFETSAIRIYCMRFLMEILRQDLHLFKTTLVSLEPQLFDSMFAVFNSRLKWRKMVLHNTPAKDEHIKKFLFNGFQRYINKIIQYKSLKNAAAAGAALAPTASLNIPAVEMYQHCFHLGKVSNNSYSAVGGRFEYILPFLPTFLEILTQYNEYLRDKNLRHIQVYSIYEFRPLNVPGHKYVSLKYIPPDTIEAYWFAVHLKKADRTTGHAVALIRKRVDYDPSATNVMLKTKQSSWYFYDDIYGIFECTPDMNTKLNEMQVDRISYSPSKSGQPTGIWKVELWKYTNPVTKTGKDGLIEIPFGTEPTPLEHANDIYVFTSLEPAAGSYIEPEFEDGENL